MAETRRKENTVDIVDAARAKRASDRRRTLLLGSAALVVLSVTLILLINVLTVRKVPTRFAFLGEDKVDDALDVTATVFYDAAPLAATASGIFLPYLPEGSRVASGERIGLIVPDTYAGDIETLLALKRAIVSRQLSVLPSGRNRAVDAVRDAVEADLRRLAADMRLSASRGDYARLPEQSRELSRFIDLGDVSLIDAAYGDAELEEQLTNWRALLFDLEQVSTVVYSDLAGIVYYGPRGSAAPLAKAEQLLGASHADLASEPAASLKMPARVEAGQTAATLVSSSKAYLAFFVPGRSAGDFRPDTVYGIRPRRGGEWQPLTIHAAREEAGGTVLTCPLPAALSDSRRVGVAELSFRIRSTRGMKVPLNALVDYEERDGIAILLKVDGGRITPVPVFVTAADRLSAIVRGRDSDPLAPAANDLYVLNPETAQAGAYID